VKTETHEPPVIYGEVPSPEPAPRWQRVFWAPIKLLMGMFFCQTIFGSLLVLGWCLRMAQRGAWHALWKRSPLRERGISFQQFLTSHEDSQTHLHWPNWFLRQNYRHDPGSGAWRRFTSLTDSLRINFWLGVQGIFCTSILALPPLVLLWFGWDYGWNMSFHKGYEQFYVGVSTAVAGILMFTAAMFYIPMAQSRQAATGNWKSFFQFRLTWQVIRENWAGCLGLAIIIALTTIPLTAMKIAPMFLSDHVSFPDVPLAELRDLQRNYLERYFFWCALYLLPVLVMLRWLSAKIYAVGLLRGLRSGSIAADDLAPNEQTVIDRLELIDQDPPVLLSPWRKAAEWLGTRLGRALSGIIHFIIWLAFAFHLVASEFLNYHTAGRGWLNQPLIQLPWIQYLPESMERPGAALAVTVLLVIICSLIRWIIHTVRKYRAHA